MRLHEGVVRTEWIDYNNHLTESRYLQVFGDASDALTSFLGVDAAYRAANGSFYTAETHLIHLREIACLEPFFVTTQILHADEKRIHLFHLMHHARTQEPLASAEQMLLHVDAETGRVSPASSRSRKAPSGASGRSGRIADARAGGARHSEAEIDEGRGRPAPDLEKAVDRKARERDGEPGLGAQPAVLDLMGRRNEDRGCRARWRSRRCLSGCRRSHEGRRARQGSRRPSRSSASGRAPSRR